MKGSKAGSDTYTDEDNVVWTWDPLNDQWTTEPDIDPTDKPYLIDNEPDND